MAKLNKVQKEQLITELLNNYQDAKCALDYTTHYELLIAVVLSAQTTDAAVNKITPALFKAAPTPAKMLELGEENLQSYIRSIGLFKNKAKHIIELSEQLESRFGGQVPGDFDALLSLPGVGRKTANVMLCEAFGQQAIAVDTHVFRLANRTGLAKASNVLDAELQLQKVIPHEYWTKMHHALIWHGRLVCKAKKPDCSSCCIKEYCKQNL